MYKQTRNETGQIEEAGIPVELREFECGCWGKHEPPTIDEGTIIIATGEGYRSNNHLHGQNLYTIEVDAENRIALIEMRKYGDMYGAGLWHYLIGVDGAPFIAQVSSNIDTLDEAVESLKPAEVKRAEAAGLEVTRQGDWYFVPVNRTPRGEVEHDRALDDDHVTEDIVALKTVTYVRGRVGHEQHAALQLDGWHKAIRNNAIRTGRLHGGGTARARYTD